jgi:hypothetical protein
VSVSHRQKTTPGPIEILQNDSCAFHPGQENLRVMAEAGIEPEAKRKCEAEGCGRPIPKWRNGKRVSSATRFCSKSCADKASRLRK